MDRCALFVDAGHLLAQGGALCCGTGRRSEFTCDYAPVIRALTKFVGDHSNLPLLRVYWYDGAANATPTLDHLRIAGLINVKLRLGRISESRQKGVDALIYRDLMTLGRERGMATAYLLAGDEDLREGVVAAQEMGVRVILLGIPSTRGGNQSEFLVREADEHVVIEKEFWSPYFSKVPVVVPAQKLAPETIHDAALAAAHEFAAKWAENASEDELRMLLGQGLLGEVPRIPADLDADLIQYVQSKGGSRLEQVPDTRRDVRASFWKALQDFGRARKDQGAREEGAST